MATYTTNYNLKKLALTDSPPDITELNGNFDTIDLTMHTNAEAISALQTSNNGKMAKVPRQHQPSCHSWSPLPNRCPEHRYRHKLSHNAIPVKKDLEIKI